MTRKIKQRTAYDDVRDAQKRVIDALDVLIRMDGDDPRFGAAIVEFSAAQSARSVIEMAWATGRDPQANPARAALTRAVNRAIAGGAPVYVDQPVKP